MRPGRVSRNCVPAGIRVSASQATPESDRLRTITDYPDEPEGRMIAGILTQTRGALRSSRAASSYRLYDMVLNDALFMTVYSCVTDGC